MGGIADADAAIHVHHVTAMAGSDAVIVIPAALSSGGQPTLVSVRWSYNNIPTGPSFLEITNLTGLDGTPVTIKFDITASGYDAITFSNRGVPIAAGLSSTITLKDGGARKHLMVGVR